MTRTLRIGTRGSALALAQARLVQRWLSDYHPALTVELVPITTSGDRFVDQPLSSLGGKGLFVKEIEDALIRGTIDCAVHSMKDVPSELPDGLVIAAIPEREDPRDVLVAPARAGVAELPRGARVGTSSLRRMALLRALRSDLDVRPLRGNVDTRLRKFDAGELGALVLAAAGLRRLGIQRDDVTLLDPQFFLPAIGQGALAIETRDDATVTLLTPFNHLPTSIAVTAERAFLRTVGGSCRTPLAAHATVGGATLAVQALIASVDGTQVIRGTRTGNLAAADAIGTDLASELLQRGGRSILDALSLTNDGR